MATVQDILEKVEKINSYIDLDERGHLNANHFGGMIELLEEYKEELLDKKIAK